jgi:hypothetical protein
VSAFEDAMDRLLGGGEAEDGELDGVTEIAKLDPFRVDAVTHPANGVPTLLIKALPAKLGAGDALEVMGRRSRPLQAVVPRIQSRVLKAGDEKRFSLHLAYPAWGIDVCQAQDGFKDTISAEQLEAGAWNFLKNGAQIGLYHADGTAGPGTGRCVESYIWRAPPWTITATDGSEQVIKAGDWMIGIQWADDGAWQAIKSGRLRGVSMMGDAVRQALSPETARRIRERRSGHG